MTDFKMLKSRIANHSTKDVGIGAREEEIAQAERELGVRLRGGYRDFLKDFGWGGVEDIEIFGLGSDVPDHLNLIALTQSERHEMHPSLPESLIPVANDGGGNLYCLDASELYRDDYPVVFWDHEAGADQQPELVSEDFVSWLMQRVEARLPS